MQKKHSKQNDDKQHLLLYMFLYFLGGWIWKQLFVVCCIPYFNLPTKTFSPFTVPNIYNIYYAVVYAYFLYPNIILVHYSRRQQKWNNDYYILHIYHTIPDVCWYTFLGQSILKRFPIRKHIFMCTESIN